MTRGCGCLLLGAAWLACVAPSCAPTDVPLATLPSGDDGGGGFNKPCTTNPDCASSLGYYCELSACGGTGTCQPIPPCDEYEENPECGCDGVTYFNDCLRKENGVGGYYPSNEPCVATTCSPTKACPASSLPIYCFEVASVAGPAPGACTSDVEGTCWVLPSHCQLPAPPGPIRWDACSGDQDEHCLDTCQAIKSQVAYKPAPEAACH